MDKKELSFFSLRSFMIFLYIIVAAAIPLALRVRIVEFISPVETWLRLASKTTAEPFAQFRLELLVMAAAAIMITALLKYFYEYEKGTITNSYVDHPTALFAFFVVLSGLFSPYINIAFWGFYNRAEGSFAYLAYLIIFLVAANLINAEKDKKIIFYAVLAAGLLHSTIAITQFFGFDVLKSDLFMRLYIPSEILSQVGDIDFMFNHKAYGTTFNPNYMGGYMAMIFPIIFVKYLYSRTTGKIILWLAAVIISLAGFFAPTSIASFIAAGLALLIFFVLTLKDFKMYYKKLLVIVIVFLVIFSVSEALSNGAIQKKISSFYRATFVTAPKSADEAVTALPASVIDIIAPGPDEKEIEIYRTPFDTFAGKRGYIWRKSLEMMKNTMIIGDGLDTFVYNFPHWDPQRDHDVYRVGLLIDKPHNTYIQIATGVGVLGLLVYLYILALHLKSCLKVFSLKGIREDSDVIMLAIFTGWLAYLIQGLSNDSVLSNAPVFWVLFGLSVNYVKNSSDRKTGQKGKGESKLPGRKMSQ